MSARRQFGRCLRALRTERGWTQRQLGAELNYSEQYVHHIESGFKTPARTLGVRVDEFFCVPGQLMAALCAEARKDQSEFGELTESEQSASAIRIYDGRLVPGLCQTRAYAASILDTVEGLEDRMRRQGVFTRTEPPECHIIISEATLYTLVGNETILREQLEFLIRPGAPWVLQVMPLAQGVHAASGGPLVLLDFESGAPATFADSVTGGTMVDDNDRVARLAKQWVRLTAEALSPKMSHDMTATVIMELAAEVDGVQ